MKNILIKGKEFIFKCKLIKSKNNNKKRWVCLLTSQKKGKKITDLEFDNKKEVLDFIGGFK